MLDPYYRTLGREAIECLNQQEYDFNSLSPTEGFMVLIEKEWLSFGECFSFEQYTLKSMVTKLCQVINLCTELDLLMRKPRRNNLPYSFNDTLELILPIIYV